MPAVSPAGPPPTIITSHIDPFLSNYINNLQNLNIDCQVEISIVCFSDLTFVPSKFLLTRESIHPFLISFFVCMYLYQMNLFDKII